MVYSTFPLWTAFFYVVSGLLFIGSVLTQHPHCTETFAQEWAQSKVWHQQKHQIVGQLYMWDLWLSKPPLWQGRVRSQRYSSVTASWPIMIGMNLSWRMCSRGVIKRAIPGVVHAHYVSPLADDTLGSAGSWQFCKVVPVHQQMWKS